MTAIAPIPDKSPQRGAVCPCCGRPFDLAARCVDCGAGFTITLAQQRYFESKKLQLPKRCDRCRQERRRSSETRGHATAPKRPDNGHSQD